ncbi:MAG: metallophosphoesterase [Anaerolineaceae bacterium]|nr:metallophosphoesterase [Anaerolineaceae bacterium]
MGNKKAFFYLFILVATFIAGVFVDEIQISDTSIPLQNILNDYIYSHPTLASSVFPNWFPQVENNYQSLNEVPLEENQQPLSFLIAGHIYGGANLQDIYPAVSLVTNVQVLNQMKPDMFVFLGDTVILPTDEQFAKLENSLLNKLSMPVYNIVGNHDVKIHHVYENRYGETVFSFQYKSHLFLFLDSTINDCALTEEQYQYIKDEIGQAQQTGNIKGIHLFIHNVLFWNDEYEANSSIDFPNIKCSDTYRFLVFMEEDLSPISEQIPVYIYSGDIGGEESDLSPFFDIFPHSNISLFATGISNHDNDSIIIAREIDGELVHSAFSLSGKGIQPIEVYDLEYWK